MNKQATETTEKQVWVTPQITTLDIKRTMLGSLTTVDGGGKSS